jgi:hypothetical protein
VPLVKALAAFEQALTLNSQNALARTPRQRAPRTHARWPQVHAHCQLNRARNPLDAIKRPKANQREMRVLTEAQAQTLIAACQS